MKVRRGGRLTPRALAPPAAHPSRGLQPKRRQRRKKRGCGKAAARVSWPEGSETRLPQRGQGRWRASLFSHFRLRSVRIVRQRRTIRARSRLQSHCQKTAEPFFDKLRPPESIGRPGCIVSSPRQNRGFLPSLPRRELPPGVVDGVLPLQNQLRDGHHRVPLPNHPLQYPRQGLRGVEGGVVEQHNAPRPHLGRDPPENGVSVIVLPVQAVPIPHTGKRPWEAALGRFATHLSPKIRPGEKPVPA